MPDLKGQTIVINTYGGSLGDAVLNQIAKPFEAATGAKVTVSTNCCGSFANQMKSNQFAGDVLLNNNYGIMEGEAKEGLYKNEPRLAEIAKARGVDSAFTRDNLIAGNYFSYVLAWNTEKAKDNHPTSWSEFFDTAKFKGPRGVPNFPFGTIEAANMASGTPASSVYPLNVESAISKLAQLRKETNVSFFNGTTDGMNQLATGQTDYAILGSNRVFAALRQGLPVDMTFNQSVLSPLGVAIPKTAKNVDGAVAFIDYYMQPEIQAAFSTSSGLAPGYPDATAALAPDIQKYMSTTPDNLKLAAKDDQGWWFKNTDATNATYTKWLSGS